MVNWPDGEPVIPWADPWHDVGGDIAGLYPFQDSVVKVPTGLPPARPARGGPTEIQGAGAGGPGDWAGGVTVASMRRWLTPREAARVKYQELLFSSMDPEGAAWMKRVTGNDAGHRWFCFCLDAVARLESP